METEIGTTDPAVEAAPAAVGDGPMQGDREGAIVPADASEHAFAQLRALMENEGFLFEFFQAVRLVQRMEPERKAVGYFHSPNQEVLRFRAVSTLAFPPSQIATIDRDEDGQLAMHVHFMGLCATVSLMPDVYVEHLLRQQKDGDKATAEFFDIFNHRLISLFYRGWEKYRFFIAYEDGRPDSLSPRMFDLLGMGTGGMRDRGIVPDKAFLAYAGLLGRHVRSAESLGQILEDFFEVRAAVQQFAGTWRSLPAQDRSELKSEAEPSGMLGVGTIVGDEVWDHHGRVRITLGPMSFERYTSFLPGNDAYLMLRHWIQFYSSGQYEAEIQLVLEREEAPGVKLGAVGLDQPLLGLVSWLKTRPLTEDPGDTMFLLT